MNSKKFNLIVLSGLLSFFLLGVSQAALAETNATANGASSRLEQEPALPEGRYALNLISSKKPINVPDIPKVKVMKNYLVYTLTREIKGIVWFTLRLGFFEKKQDAKRVRDQLGSTFPGAWIETASDQEKARAVKRALHIFGAKPGPQTGEGKSKSPEKVAGVGVTGAPAAGPTPDKLDRWMEDSERAMTAKDYRRAIQIFTKIQQSPQNRYSQRAQELLALARERLGQLAHAKAEYEKYLLLYPEGEGADRVRQRLAGLLTARKEPKKSLRKAKSSEELAGWQKSLFGSFSQFYTREESITDLFGNIANRSTLSSDLDFDGRMRNPDTEIGYQFIVGYDADFKDSSNDTARVNELYLYGRSRNRYFQGQVGRQSYSTGGVLGRFDGLLVGYGFSPGIRLNGVFGFPVLSTTSGIKTDVQLYGINFDLGTFGNQWDFNTYIIQQASAGIVDRRAIGGEARFFGHGLSLFSLVDYDIFFGTTNIILFVGNLILPTGTTFNASFEYRRSPVLTSTNALVGQTAKSLKELLNTLTEDEVLQLARDRTPIFKSMTLGGSTHISERLQVSLNLTASELGDSKASGGVDAVPGSGIEYFTNLQLIGSSLIVDGDIAILGGTYSHTQTYNTISMNLNTRYPVGRTFRFNPRAVVSYKKERSGTANEISATPSLRIEVQPSRYFNVELDGGYEWIREGGSVQIERSSGYFVTVGYRINF